MKNIASALDKFHQLVPNIPKSAKNPYFSSQYAPLDAILPAIKEPLHKAGLVFTQFPSGDYGLRTILIHVESGESLEETFSMRPSKDDPQGRGAAITYARRFALVSILGLNTDEDDDGNGASKKDEKPKKESLPKQEEAPKETTKFNGPNHKELFQKLISEHYTQDDFMEAMKYSGKIPETASDFFKMTEKSATRFLEEYGYVVDAIIEYRCMKKP